jgi:hypothetical protein
MDFSTIQGNVAFKSRKLPVKCRRYQMNFIVYLLNQPNFASWIAFSAFLFSLLSLLWTKKSVRISQKALNESTSNNQRVAESEIEQKRLELLKEICDEHEMLENALTDMGVLKANYDASPQMVKKLMRGQASIFTNYLPLLEKYKLQVEYRHEGALKWKSDNGVAELYRLLSEQYVATKNTKYSVTCNVSVVAEYKAKFEMANNYRPTAHME